MFQLDSLMLFASFLNLVSGSNPDPRQPLPLAIPRAQPHPPWQSRHQLFCQGSLPAQWRQVQYRDHRGDHYATYRTPQEFCALSHYGGNPAFNLGGSWDTFFGRTKVQRSFFANLLPVSRPIPNSPEIFCSLRCSHLPMPESRNEALLEFWSNFRIQRLADPQRGSLRYTPFQQAIFTPQTREINVLLGREAWPNGDGPGYGSRVALQRPPSWYSSILRCRGDLPRGPWPPPFDNINPQDQDEYSRHRTFRDVTAICAAHWFGGDVRGNAGMVCRKSISGRFKLKQEPYLAHPALYRENPRGGIFIDFWCHRACDCPTTDEEKQRPLKNKISVAELTGVDNGMVIFHPSGSILVARQESRKTTLYRVAPWTPEQTAACLSTDPQEECPSSDQIDAIILSDLMKEAPDPTFPAAEVVAKVKPKTCGRSCTGPSDCSQADDCGSCVFHPDFRAIHASGLSPFIPLAAAMCLTLASGNRGRLNGRDFGIKSDLSDVICACNATYVSQGCCRAAPSGIVHEDFRPGAASVNLLKL